MILLQVPAPVVDDSGIVHLTEKNFMNYLVNQPGVHFVKFYAPWCVNVCMCVCECVCVCACVCACGYVRCWSCALFHRCGHCQNLAPTWIELATYFEPEKQVHIIKVRLLG